MKDNKIIIEIDIPQRVYDSLETLIRQTIEKTLNDKVSALQKKIIKYTRKEASKILKVSLPTLDSYINQGLLQKQTIGRRVLIPADSIEGFLNRHK